MDSSSQAPVTRVQSPVTRVSANAAPADVAGGLTSVGVDVSKDSLEVALQYDAKSFNVRNDLSGITLLLKRLPAVGTCVVVLEGSGGI